MPGSEGVMILISKLYDRAAELSEIIIHEIFEIVARKDGLFLKNAYIAPGIDNLRLHIPQSRVTDKIGIVMKETRRTYNLPVSGSLDIYQLGRLRTHQYNETVLLFLLLGKGGQTQ